MRVIFRCVVGLILAACAGCRAGSAGDRLSDSFIHDHAVTYGFSSGRPTSISVTPAGDAVLFLRSGPRDNIRNLYSFDTATGKTVELLTAESLLKVAEETLSPEEKARRERRRESGRGLVAYQLSPDGSQILVTLGGKLYLVRRSDRMVRELAIQGGASPVDPKFSPDGKAIAFVGGQDVRAIDLDSGVESAVTTGGTADVSHGLAEFVAQEEMDRFSGYWWGGDGRHIAFEEVDSRPVETLHIMDPFSPEKDPQTFRYPRAGKPNVIARLGIAERTGGAPVWVEWDRARYPYLASVHWGKEPLTVYVQTRDQREALLLAVDPATGKTTTLLRETDEAWINIVQGMPKWLDDDTFLWQTERSGHWQIEVHGRDGALRHTLSSPGGTELKGVVALDKAKREIVVSASEDPTQDHLYRIALDSGEAERLTQSVGSHGGSFSECGTYWVHSASLPDGNRLDVVRKRDGEAIGPLPSVGESPSCVPNLELTAVDVSGRTLHAAILRPHNFSGLAKYPVLLRVYGGPHAQMVTAAGRSYFRDQWLADQGFIIVSIDGRGTPGRGRDWERAIRGNVIDGPMDDQIAGLKAVAARYSQLDLKRVGIYGWSFGGYFSVMAALKRPDVFHAAVAGAPVTDWADYDTHYTERYLGVPPATLTAQRPGAEAPAAGVCPVLNRSTHVAGASSGQAATSGQIANSGDSQLQPMGSAAPADGAPVKKARPLTAAELAAAGAPSRTDGRDGGQASSMTDGSSDPATEPYRICSALTYANDLRCPLLLIHGTSDDNVYFLHTLRLADALNKAGKPFTMLPMPGSAHGPSTPAMTETVWRRHAAFFKEKLVDGPR